MHARGIKVSLFLNAASNAFDPALQPARGATRAKESMTEEYWIKAVRAHIDLIKQQAIPVDAVHLDSWARYPGRNLPETDPLAWTSLVNYAYDQLARQQ